MITPEEIAARVYEMLQNSSVKESISGVIDYERNDYDNEDVIIIPHRVDGESSVRYGQINVNIHVPDIAVRKEKGKSVYRIDFERLIAIRAKVIDVLKNHYEIGCGYNWTIGALNPPIKEPNHNEHYVSLALELTIREKSINQ